MTGAVGGAAGEGQCVGDPGTAVGVTGGSTEALVTAAGATGVMIEVGVGDTVVVVAAAEVDTVSYNKVK